MSKRTPPHKNNPLITEAKFRSMIISALRNASRWWSPANIAIENACVGIRVNANTGKKAKHYKCASCKKIFIRKDVAADHISPVILPEQGFVDWNTFIDRLFAPVYSYQCICTRCHKNKTDEERRLKKEYEKRIKGNTDKS